jgi:hypothetical protein
MIAALAAIVPRLLSGPTEHPVFPMSTPSSELIRQTPRLQMGLQAAIAALVIVGLNQWFRPGKVCLGHHCMYLRDSRLCFRPEWTQGTPADYRNRHWCPARSRLSPNCGAVTDRDLDFRGGGDGCLCHGAPSAIRYRLRGRTRSPSS